MASSFNRLKELDLSPDEVNRLGEALKNDEFRNLLTNYVEEVQDPRNREIYEEEVRQIERERGQELTFLHPTPGYVIKTSINRREKAFVNICSNQNIKKPLSLPSVKDGVNGLEWTIPHSISPPREDLDNKGIRCQVYDVLFHPNTLLLAKKNQDFYSMVNNIALSAIETNYNSSLDKKNIKFPKLSYKGFKHATVMRKPSNDSPIVRTSEEQAFFDKIYEQIDSNRIVRESPKMTSKSEKDSEHPNYTTPEYLLKHRSYTDIQDFTPSRNATNIPKELILDVYLPLLKSSTDMQLNVTEKTMQLISEKPAKYKLNLTLPYHVEESNGSAKFDKDLKKLTITLSVKRRVFESVREDSGVESCVETDLNSPISYESDYNSDEKISENFLDPNVLYILPEFTFNIFNNIIACTFHVKKVIDSSVFKNVSLDNSLVTIKFAVVGTSFYHVCYAFSLKFLSHYILNESEVKIETWDNNVILQVPLKVSEKPLESFLYGISENNLIEKFIEDPVVLVNQLSNTVSDYSSSEKEDTSLPEQKLVLKESSSAIDIFMNSYESSGDELSSSSFSPYRSKGILKRISSARSISESSLEEFVCSSLENYQGGIDCVPEDSREDDEISSSFKKTVRFNDVVIKQLFRSTASILGQKKKNQRKARNKKRAHERRYSESEASDTESKQEVADQTIMYKKENILPAVTDEETKENKDDADIFHLEINN